MAKLRKNRTLQYPLQAEFTFNFNDTATDAVAAVDKSFGSTFTDNIVFDAIALPPNAVVIGGDVTVETAYVGPTAATVAIGDSGNAARYLAATSMLAAGRTALVPTGYRGNGEDLRLTLNTTVANATAGKVSVRVLYTITGRANETQIT